MSGKTPWTPGPWEACEPGDYGDFDGNSRVVCSTENVPIRIAVVHWHDNSDWRDENDANARLIAAAPEMAKALQDAERSLEEFCRDQHPDNVCCHTLRNIQALLGKIEGGVA